LAAKRPNVHKVIPTLQDPPKIYPNWDFWFENIPSGDPAKYSIAAITITYICGMLDVAKHARSFVRNLI
jgi:hypothetical protein